MTSAVMNVPGQQLPGSTEPENEIRGIFLQHWEKMKDQMQASINAINKWRQDSIENINKYAEEQLRHLLDDYDRQRLNLAKTCEENLETTRAYYDAQNAELFNELRNACRLLEFQVAQLESINGTMAGPKVITVQEQMERKKKEHSDASRSENDKSEERRIIEHTNNIQDNQNENRNASVNLISSISSETHPHLSVVESSKVDNNHDSQARTKNADNSINKCPICYMIFPLSMTQDDRSQHVNEHCTDD